MAIFLVNGQEKSDKGNVDKPQLTSIGNSPCLNCEISDLRSAIPVCESMPRASMPKFLNVLVKA